MNMEAIKIITECKKLPISGHPLWDKIWDQYCDAYNNLSAQLQQEDIELIIQLSESAMAVGRLGNLEAFKMGYHYAITTQENVKSNL